MIPSLADVRSILRDAAQSVLTPAAGPLVRQTKSDGSIVTSTDLALQERIGQELERRWPHIVFLGEEMPEAEQRRLLESPNTLLWCLDPLDGTSNYAAGFPLFSISLALLEQGRPVLGAVYDPTRDECFAAEQGGGATLNDQPLPREAPPRQLSEAIALVDFKRLPRELARRVAAGSPVRSLRSLGSAALEWCWLAAGRAHVYLHGRQRLWDYSAGHLILEESGGAAETLSGESLLGDGLASRSVTAATNEALMRQWRDWLDRARTEENWDLQ